MRRPAAWGLALAALALATIPGRAQSPAAVVPSITGASLVVTDLARSMRFYEAVGMTVGMHVEGDKGYGETSLSFPASPGSHATAVLLMHFPTDPTTIAHGNARTSIMIRVPDAEAVEKRLRIAGFTSGALQVAGKDMKILRVKDPDGYNLMITQIASEAISYDNLPPGVQNKLEKKP